MNVNKRSTQSAYIIVGKIVDNTSVTGHRANLFWRIANFIGRDIKEKNESKKPVVVIRLLLIATILYFSANILLCVPKISMGIILFSVSVFAVFVGLFAMSYYCSSFATLLMFNAGMIVWVWAILHFLGWNVGVQHFLMVLLVLCFFATYRHYALKCLYALFLCALRILFFYLYHSRTPVMPLSSSDETALQVLNTLTIFLCISIVSLVFSRDSQKLECKLVEYNAQLEKLANTDTLTGLYNRRKAMQYMESLTQDNGLTDFSMCICDIDFFKRVNDQYGHDFGDEVLRAVSQIFLETMTGRDFVARWGGEEFLLLFVGCNGDVAYQKLSQLRRKIKDMRVKKGDVEIGITMTYGLTEYDFNHDLNASLVRADENLYIGKEQGRDRIIY